MTTNGTANGASAFLIARASLDHGAGFAVLVAQLNERRAALGAQPRQFGEIAPAGAFGIDDGIEAEIDGDRTFIRRP